MLPETCQSACSIRRQGDTNMQPGAYIWSLRKSLQDGDRYRSPWDIQYTQSNSPSHSREQRIICPYFGNSALARNTLASACERRQSRCRCSERSYRCRRRTEGGQVECHRTWVSMGHCGREAYWKTDCRDGGNGQACAKGIQTRDSNPIDTNG